MTQSIATATKLAVDGRKTYETTNSTVVQLDPCGPVEAMWRFENFDTPLCIVELIVGIADRDLVQYFKNHLPRTQSHAIHIEARMPCRANSCIHGLRVPDEMQKQHTSYLSLEGDVVQGDNLRSSPCRLRGTSAADHDKILCSLKRYHRFLTLT